MKRKRRTIVSGTRRSTIAPFIGVSDRTAGLPPGSPVYIGDQEPTKATFSIYTYSPSGWEMSCPLDLDALLKGIPAGGISWININGLSGGAVEVVCRHFGIHSLTMEDILNTEHRPKMEMFDDVLFAIAKMIMLRPDGSIEYEQVSLLLKGSTVITIQERPGDCFKPVRDRIVSGHGKLRHKGADYLFYSIIDVIVDNYFLVLEHIGDSLAGYEDTAMTPGSRSFMSGLQGEKIDLLKMRKIIWPVRDSISSLLRFDGGLIGADVVPYLRDLHENTVQIIETLETYREYASSLVEIHLSAVNNRMGEVVKVLTIISTIFIPLTFIAGVYGMNFKFMPELNSRWGYPVVIGSMVAVAIAELVYFRRKGWI